MNTDRRKGEPVRYGDILSDAWALDLATLTWSRAADLPEPLSFAAAAILGSGSGLAASGIETAAAEPVRMLIFGGLGDQGQPVDRQIIYDPAAKFKVYLPLVLNGGAH